MTILDNRGWSIAILLLAAILEAGGDAVVRKALHSEAQMPRLLLFAAGGLILSAYGYAVNAPAWDFGSLLGLYVVFFFLVSQTMSWLIFGQPPSMAVMAGGSLITVGGCVIAFGT
jgi:small multidrug resistance family-3 protein